MRSSIYRSPDMLNSPTLTDSDAHTLAYSEITYNSPTQTTDDDPLHPVHSQKHSLRHNLSTFTSRCVFAICVAFMLIVFACAMLKISMEFSKSGSFLHNQKMKPKATEQIETKPSKRIWKNILMTSVYIFIGIIVIGGFLSASYLLLREILKVMKK